MKHLIWIALIALMLGACSKDENTTPAADAPDDDAVAETIDEITPTGRRINRR